MSEVKPATLDAILAIRSRTNGAFDYQELPSGGIVGQHITRTYNRPPFTKQFEIRPGFIRVLHEDSNSVDMVTLDKRQAIEMARVILKYYGVTENA